ncbi:hypothetical protein [Aquimarina sp. 2304DJ70-9]|uniref:hypothetical protein n=1 Tax=Aquimarina penaris TaxID=3231044 RepID=UPI0034628906
MGFNELWGKIKGTKSYRPARIIIPQKNIEPKLKKTGPFQRHKQYFEVTVNEMYLTYQRKWFKEWEPIVFVGSKFLYDGKFQEVPFFVGQKMLLEGKKDDTLPGGMIFKDTKVAGLHPYRGGNFSISIVLGRAERNDYLRKVLNLIENTSKTYLSSFGTSVLPYVKAAKIVLDGYEDLVDSKDVEPLIGHQITLNPDTQEDFFPGYFALINEPEESINPNDFFVINGKLHHGITKDKATRYDKDDYVLYSILATGDRSDIEALPYYEHFKKIQELISGMGEIKNEQMNLINAKLYALSNMVRMSPDLIRDQVDDQIADFRHELKEMVDDRKPLSGDKKQLQDKRDDWEKKMDIELLSILTNKK